MNIFIKRADISDVPEIAKLFDAYRVFYKQESDLALASTFLSDRINHAESIIFVAVTEQNKYVGFTQLYPSFSSAFTQRIWILNDLYVEENSRGNGIAKKLMNKAKEFAKETQARGISLNTEKTNTIAQNLYESLGYEKNTIFYNYFLTI
ncbi:MAG: GNAT family N-acetyltransferase [Aquificaceae bacterium]|nr:MAG: GNAT family N-acetyltransferase [Aquificaceae bacterium]